MKEGKWDGWRHKAPMTDGGDPLENSVCSRASGYDACVPCTAGGAPPSSHRGSHHWIPFASLPSRCGVGLGVHKEDRPKGGVRG